MAPAIGRTDRALSTQLLAEAQRFDFFQAVWLLERLERNRAGSEAEPRRGPVGGELPPDREMVRFRALPSLNFPPGDISRIASPGPAAARDSARAPLEMTVGFMGLFGPHGVLPRHYTSLLIDRCHSRNKDYALRDFLDLFNHRTISLFYRAWEKYRFPIGYERWRTECRRGSPAGTEVDLFTFCLRSLAGLATKGLQGRMAVDDESVIYYGGHFAHFPRTADSLEALLADYFELPIEILPFQGQWLRLSPEQRTCLPGPDCPEGNNHKLGVSVIVGTKVWSVQGKFRVRIGPLTYQQFQEFMPTGLGLKRLCQLTRLYVGQEFDFDVQAILLAAEVPWCQLAGKPAGARRLGWNSWVRCKTFSADVDDAVFVLNPG